MPKVSRIESNKYLELENSFSNTTFLQSSDWIKFKVASSGYSSEYFEILKDSELIGAFGILVKKQYGINTAYITRTNMFFDSSNTKYLSEVLSELKKIFLVIVFEGDTFFNSPDLPSLLTPINFEIVDKYIQPPSTFITNTNTVSDDLSHISSSSHKSNIKKGLKNIESLGYSFSYQEKLNDSDLEATSTLINLQAKNRGYIARKTKYFSDLQSLVKNAHWFVIRNKEGNVVLSNLVILDSKTKTCFAIYIGKDKSADELLLYYALKHLSMIWCKQNGYINYDHWGIFKEHPGFSDFKKRFGGVEVSYPKLAIYISFPLSLLKKLIIKRI